MLSLIIINGIKCKILKFQLGHKRSMYPSLAARITNAIAKFVPHFFQYNYILEVPHKINN